MGLPDESWRERVIFTVTDLKQYAYCPRIVFYTYCLPLIRPTTGKMEEGRLAHEEARDRERRRTLRIYGLEEARRHFDVLVASEELGLTGRIDLVLEIGAQETGARVSSFDPASRSHSAKFIWRQEALVQDSSRDTAACPSRREWIPVDYKQTERRAGPHVRWQLAAYGIMLEETWGGIVRRGFIYSLLTRRVEEIPLTRSLRQEIRAILAAMREMVERERMPDPPLSRRPCVHCEFRRFCNDVL
ncbi:MAG: CRISPR-associated protein Cas4 [Anaerolineae bacterium]|nr:CRISPR-associated protein Cas4 [Anaerolineae bacterium]MDW8069236.1 CRISPR-associated protein Cas4 [Anaerolineae bacterium]